MGHTTTPGQMRPPRHSVVKRTPTGKVAGAFLRGALAWHNQAWIGQQRIVHHMDWLPTFVAAAGKNDIKEDLLDGYRSAR